MISGKIINYLSGILLPGVIIISSLISWGCESSTESNCVIPTSDFIQELVNGDFESGDLRGWSKESARSNSIELCTDPVREGKYSAKLTLFPEDYVNFGNRVELSKSDCDLTGMDVSYSFSYMLDENYEESDLVQTIQQFHDQPDFSKGEDWSNYTKRPPPISLRYKNGSIQLIINDINSGLKNIASFAMLRGIWYDFKFIVKWSTGNKGYVQLNVNGIPVTPFNGENYKYYFPTIYNKSGNYFKVGLYRDNNISSTNIVYVDNFLQEILH